LSGVTATSGRCGRVPRSLIRQLRDHWLQRPSRFAAVKVHLPARHSELPPHHDASMPNPRRREHQIEAGNLPRLLHGGSRDSMGRPHRVGRYDAAGLHGSVKLRHLLSRFLLGRVSGRLAISPPRGERELVSAAARFRSALPGAVVAAVPQPPFGLKAVISGPIFSHLMVEFLPAKPHLLRVQFELTLIRLSKISLDSAIIRTTSFPP